jgi:hypothetical protein
VSMSGPRGGGFLGPLRAMALVAVLVGAIGSVGLTLSAGRHSPRFLLVLFLLWVLSPFVAFLLVDRVSKGWSVLTRATLYSVMLVVTLSSLAIYGNVVWISPTSRPAPVFLLVPLGSWLLMAVVVSMAALASRRRSRRGAGA